MVVKYAMAEQKNIEMEVGEPVESLACFLTPCVSCSRVARPLNCCLVATRSEECQKDSGMGEGKGSGGQQVQGHSSRPR